MVWIDLVSNAFSYIVLHLIRLRCKTPVVVLGGSIGIEIENNLTKTFQRRVPQSLKLPLVTHFALI